MVTGRATRRGRSVGPDYICIGAQRCGTTSLRTYLNAHPQISSYGGETNFFTQHFRKGVTWYESVLGNGEIRGEKTPEYIVCPYVPKRIKATCPNVKLIVMLRNPVDRIQSHFRLATHLNNERKPFEKAYRGGIGLRRPGWYSYLRRGHYAEQLEHWFKFFPREQFLIVHSERFFEDTDTVYQEILEFLGAKPYHLETYRRAGRVPVKKPDLSLKMLTMLQGYYRLHNERLYELLDYDFGWNA